MPGERHPPARVVEKACALRLRRQPRHCQCQSRAHKIAEQSVAAGDIAGFIRQRQQQHITADPFVQTFRVAMLQASCSSRQPSLERLLRPGGRLPPGARQAGGGIFRTARCLPVSRNTGLLTGAASASRTWEARQRAASHSAAHAADLPQKV